MRANISPWEQGGKRGEIQATAHSRRRFRGAIYARIARRNQRYTGTPISTITSPGMVVEAR
jgi:hypothetical protein